eukprot:gene43567-12359_t
MVAKGFGGKLSKDCVWRGNNFNPGRKNNVIRCPSGYQLTGCSAYPQGRTYGEMQSRPDRENGHSSCLGRGNTKFTLFANCC